MQYVAKIVGPFTACIHRLRRLEDNPAAHMTSHCNQNIHLDTEKNKPQRYLQATDESHMLIDIA